MVIVAVFGAWLNAKADESLPSSTPDFPSVIRAYSDQLATIESDKEASNLFVSAIGPALQLGDAARTLGSYPLPAISPNWSAGPIPDTNRLLASLSDSNLAN